MEQKRETVTHIIDAVTIPSGVAVGLAHIMELVNGVMTFLVLLTSLVWGVYRIIDMYEKRQIRKDLKEGDKL